jgi:hypothetical protein
MSLLLSAIMTGFVVITVASAIAFICLLTAVAFHARRDPIRR